MRKPDASAAALIAVVLAVVLAGPALAPPDHGVASASSNAKKAVEAGPRPGHGQQGPARGRVGTYLGWADISGGPAVLKGQYISQDAHLPHPRYFCFFKMPFTPNVASATLDTRAPATRTSTRTVLRERARRRRRPVCPGPEQASVVTNASNGNLGNAEFQVVFF